MAAILLAEHETRELELSLETAEWLRADHPRELEVVRSFSSQRYRVTPKSFVGSIVTPQVEFHIRPKCGTQNLFYLLTYAYRLARVRRELTAFEEVGDLREFLLEILAGQLEELLRMGLRSEYLEVEADEPVLRGRLLLDRLARRPPGRELVLPVRYEEFTPDVPANRVFRYTLETLPRAKDSRVQGRLARCLRALGFVSREPFTPARIDAFPYTRLNVHYESPHQLCRLLLEASGLEGRAGSRPMSTFLIDMNAVFERFVAGWLAEHLPPGLVLQTQAQRHLDVSRELPIRPDILLTRSGSPVGVADTKYKILEDPRPRPGDAYQMLAYCRALGLAEGALIYVADEPSARAFTVVDGETTIHCWSLALGGSPEEIEESMRGLASRMQRLIEGSGPAAVSLSVDVRSAERQLAQT